MYKNKNINFDLFDIDEGELLRLTKYCEWKNCDEKGIYKAPTSRVKLRKFKWFCLKHVKLYNKGWDYFKGRSTEEINSELSEDARWHRQTTKKKKQPYFRDEFVFFRHENQHKVGDEKNHTCQTVQEALFILAMNMPENLNALKKQYKVMVKKFHPDLNKIEDKDKIIKLNEAYAVLLKYFKD